MTYTVAVDFDGVIHSYTSGWVDGWLDDPVALLDAPVDGAIDWLWHLVQGGFEVVILTTRGQYDGCAKGINDWLYHYAQHTYPAWPNFRVTHEKVPALVYVDDRAWRFNGPGTYPTVQQIRDARPWNKPKENR